MRTKGGRGLITFENCVSTEEKNSRWNLENAIEELLLGEEVSGVIETEETARKKNKETEG